MKIIKRTRITPTHIQVHFRDGRERRIRLTKKLCEWVVQGCQGKPQGLPKLSRSLRRQLIKEIQEKQDRKSWFAFLNQAHSPTSNSKTKKRKEREATKAAKRKEREATKAAKRKERIRARENEKLEEYRRRGREVRRTWRSAIERWCEAHDVGAEHPDWRHYSAFRQNAAAIFSREKGRTEANPSAEELRRYFADRYPLP